MRTTLTLDEDVARLIEEAVHQQRRPMKQVVNDALRRALTPPRTDQAIYKVVPHHSGIRPGVDLAGLNRLADEIEDEPTVGKALRSS